MTNEARHICHASGLDSIADPGPREMLTPRLTADWRVERMLRFIDTEGGKLGWEVSQLCTQLELGISGSHAAKLFSRHTGIGIREYAKQRRLALAAKQLQTTTDSVKQIALELGYRTPNDLRRQFKKLFYLNPTAFREAHRQADIRKRDDAVPAKVIRFGGGKM